MTMTRLEGGGRTAPPTRMPDFTMHAEGSVLVEAGRPA
jgi:hypothetical protein